MPFDEDIARRLEEACAKHRVVFWQDENSEFADEISELSLGNTTVAMIGDDEFAWKRRVLRGENPAERFLVYRSGEAPSKDLDFLYDIRLEAFPFSCSQSSVWASESGLPVGSARILEGHAEFFGSKERRLAFKTLCEGAEWMQEGAGTDDIEFTMLCAACKVKSTIRIDAVRGVGRCLLCEAAKKSDEVARLVSRCDLDDVLARCLSAGFGYSSDNPGVDDFVIEVLASACCDVTGKEPNLNGEGNLLLDSFSRDKADSELYDAYIERFSGYIEAECDFSSCDCDALVANMYLPGVDTFLIKGYLDSLAHGVDCAVDIAETTARRSPSLASDSVLAAYGALGAASSFEAGFKAFEDGLVSVASAKACLDEYVGNWYRIDEDYRHFRTSLPAASDSDFGSVAELVEAHYGRFLADLSRVWQSFIESDNVWPPAGVDKLQHDFYRDNIFLGGSGRKAVIISDALRYECAVELGELLTSAGHTTKPSWVLSVLPSYTQLGMAALLPNDSLTFETSSLRASADGNDVTGSKNRAEALAAQQSGSAVVDAENILTGEKSELVKLEEASLTYIYHNKIDAVGDKRDSEKEVFDAVVTAFGQIAKLVHLCAKAGYDRVIITADHGFIYQNADPSTFEYAYVELLDEIKDAGDGRHSRRFIAAKTMPEDEVLVEFTAMQAGLDGDFKIGIPKGIRRLKLKGSGARFVHGGMTLQETLVPVLTVVPKGKKGAVKPEPVGVEILTGGSKVVNSSTLSCTIMQTEPVSATRLSQVVRVGAYDGDGKAVSPLIDMELASASDDPAARQTPIKLAISPDVANGSKVILRVEGKIGTTNKYTMRTEQIYTVRRNFGMDF